MSQRLPERGPQPFPAPFRLSWPTHGVERVLLNGRDELRRVLSFRAPPAKKLQTKEAHGVKIVVVAPPPADSAIARPRALIPNRVRPASPPTRVRVAPPRRVGRRRIRPAGAMLALAALVALVLLVLTGARAQPLRSSLPASHPAAAPAPASWLRGTTLVTIYGRGFGTAPVLGRLGLDHSLSEVARGLAADRQAIAAQTGRRTRVAIHLIYAMATPCQSADTCLAYLDENGVDLVKQYIEPAARRGWLVILDDQLSRSNPVSELEHMRARGYFRYDNVEVAFDPEFRTVPGQTTPGVPLGSVSVDELNAAQRLLNRYTRRGHLAHRKLLLVHEWTPSMITGAGRLRGDFRFVQPVLVMDGIGTPLEKTHDYQQLFQRQPLPAGVSTGLKLFPDGAYTLPGQVDIPLMSWPQVFGHAPVDGTAGGSTYLRPAPRVIVLT